MKQRAIKFNDDQWALVQELAANEGVSAGDFVRECVHLQARRLKRAWPGSRPWRGPRK
jgi:hypothetical protein